MIRRARMLAVLATLLGGAIGVIGATQTWLTVTLDDGAADALLVPGASAVPVLTPLCLAALALGGALSIVGPVLRYAFGVLGLLIAGVLAVTTAQVVFAVPVSAVAGTVTEATGIAGNDAVAGLLGSVSLTPWPVVSLIAAVLLGAASVFTLVTAHRWSGGAGRKYRTDAAGAGQSRPHDAIDSWDDLSRGEDPTS